MGLYSEKSNNFTLGFLPASLQISTASSADSPTDAGADTPYTRCKVDVIVRQMTNFKQKKKHTGQSRDAMESISKLTNIEFAG